MSRGRAETRSPTSCKTRVAAPCRKHALPQRGHGRCLKLRLRRMIFACGKSSGLVMPSLGSGKYCPGPDTAEPSMAKHPWPGIYGICSLVSWSFVTNDAKDSIYFIDPSVKPVVVNFLDFMT